MRKERAKVKEEKGEGVLRVCLVGRKPTTSGGESNPENSEIPVKVPQLVPIR